MWGDGSEQMGMMTQKGISEGGGGLSYKEKERGVSPFPGKSGTGGHGNNVLET